MEKELQCFALLLSVLGSVGAASAPHAEQFSSGCEHRKMGQDEMDGLCWVCGT